METSAGVTHVTTMQEQHEAYFRDAETVTTEMHTTFICEYNTVNMRCATLTLCGRMV
jgi:hypothetical protein